MPLPAGLGQADADAPAFEPPGLDQRGPLELADEVGGRLSSDEEATADLAGVQLDCRVQELHGLDLRERRPEIEERIGELGSQEAMDAPLRVDQSPSAGSLPLHRKVLPRGADMSRAFMKGGPSVGSRGAPRSEPPVRVLTARTVTPTPTASIPPSLSEF
jgi:hypothetical protein